jgi:hypothetical protein
VLVKQGPSHKQFLGFVTHSASDVKESLGFGNVKKYSCPLCRQESLNESSEISPLYLTNMPAKKYKGHLPWNLLVT